MTGDEAKAQALLKAFPEPLTYAVLKDSKLPDAIAADLIFAGAIHNVIGRPKAGKSWFALQLAVCVALGMPFLGRKTQRRKVLYLSLDMSAPLVWDRVRKILELLGQDPPAEFFETQFRLVAPVPGGAPVGVDLSDPETFPAMNARIKAQGAEVVFFDTLYRFTGSHDALKSPDMGRLFENLRSTATETGAALVLVDHGRKNNTEEQTAATAAYGSVTKAGPTDVAIAIKKSERTWKVEVEGWYCPAQDFHYKLPASGFGCVPSDSAEAAGATLARIVEVFTKHGAYKLFEVSDGATLLRVSGFAFPTQGALASGLKAEGLAPGDNQHRAVSMVKDYTTDAARGLVEARPILRTTQRGNKAEYDCCQ